MSSIYEIEALKGQELQQNLLLKGIKNKQNKKAYGRQILMTQSVLNER